ncbi:hypothetical protein [Methylobacterium soli]|uniref:hypothetical protein n=1 Tax=Methylobacterium soli TaxID=553447 RepID=UPI001EE2495C|nr:hypothetical protein [Methylobacterium soli]
MADRHIAEAEARILRQQALIKRLSESKRDLVEAEKLLALLEQTLIQMREHRHIILDTIARLDPSTP